ncbi:uncharacterized protein LOC135323771 [Dromaius novaehollandiae]|uniref:uncharacterized protein LOC135323771 n=1 Tax=Dromaius novaehollandiae TaxID=8790 RepID=UPI00311E62A1
MWNFCAGICKVPSAVWAGFVFALVDFHVWELHASTLTQQHFLVRRIGIPRSGQNWAKIAALLCNKGKRIQQATPELPLSSRSHCAHVQAFVISEDSIRESRGPQRTILLSEGQSKRFLRGEGRTHRSTLLEKDASAPAMKEFTGAGHT